MNGTHHPVPTACILGPFQPATVTVGNNKEGALDTRDGGVGVRDTMANGWNGWNCFCCGYLLEGGS